MVRCLTLLGLVGTSLLTVVKVVMPGNPVYLEYVRSTVAQKKERYNAAQGGPKGNPDLVYETQFIEGWEPSGEPVIFIHFLPHV